MKLLIQIPCLNEAQTLPETLRDLPRSLPGVESVQVLVIDDGSHDGTAQVAADCGADYILRHTQTRGLAAAFASGLDACLRLGADLIVNTDADHQYAGADVERLIAPILAGQADLVIGDRQPGTNHHFSWLKRHLQRLGSRVVALLAGRPIPDAVSGFRAMSRQAALRLHVLTSFSYTLETLLQAAEQGLAIAFVPVRTHPTCRPSRLFHSIPQFLFRSAATLLRVYAMYQPLKIFGGLSLLLMLAGSLPIIRFLGLFALGQGGGHIQSLVLGGVLFLTGCLTLALGILGDLIAFNRRLLEMMLEKVRGLEAASQSLPAGLYLGQASQGGGLPAACAAPCGVEGNGHVARTAGRAGLTLVELLVVIAIVGVLAALLLPAVQSTRETARRLQCAGHLKQLALAVHAHESVHRHLPTGGWTKDWAGLPDRGFAEQQPGGWIYNLLPYLEQQAIHALGGSQGPAEENGRRLQSPVVVLHCPSRRRPANYLNERRWQPHLYPLVEAVARNDYAINGGTQIVRFGSGPPGLAAASHFRWPRMDQASGVCYQRSRVRLAEIVDGTSHTYLLGEKHVPRAHYTSGRDRGDNEGAFSGDDRDLIRFTGPAENPSFRPRNDLQSPPARLEGYTFGGPHPTGVQMAFCDGSVRMIPFTISQLAHSRLGGRADGPPPEDFQ